MVSTTASQVSRKTLRRSPWLARCMQIERFPAPQIRLLVPNRGPTSGRRGCLATEQPVVRPLRFPVAYAQATAIAMCGLSLL